MSIHPFALGSMPVSTSTPETSPPAGTVPAPLIRMPSGAAEAIIRDAVAAAFRAAPGTVTEIGLLDHVDLRLARTADGVEMEINDTDAIYHIWSHFYRNEKWAFRGVANAIVDAELGLVLASAPGRIKSRKAPAKPVNAETIPTETHDTPASIWRKVTSREQWEAIFGEGRSRVTAAIYSDMDGADATIWWLGTEFHNSYDCAWDAKSSSIKLANALIGWRPAAASVD